MGTPHAAVVGTVESWNDRDGWGVLRTPGGRRVFCHYSQLDLAASVVMVPGLAIAFDYEEPGQDGCDARVLTAARPAAVPGWKAPRPLPPGEMGGDTGAYRSDLTITWDDEVDQ